MDIIKVVLRTNQLEKMKNFYSTIFELPIISTSNDSFEIKLGITTLVFTNKNVKGNPYYHFALDIPYEQFNEAKEWIKKKIPLLTEEGEDEVYFSHLNAKSFYFEDPSGNIIEFIARSFHSQPNNHFFSQKNILKISEISLVVDNKLQVAKQLENHSIINREKDEMTENNLSFMTKGNLPVYLLLVQPNRRWFFSSKKSAIFPLDIFIDSKIQLGIQTNNDFYIQELK